MRAAGRRPTTQYGASRLPDPTQDRFLFPDGFLWGAATAAHQVEGDNRASDWWAFEQAGALPFRSGEACRHYELFERDFDLARGWGHNAHRLSIEWSRIEPRPGEWDSAALAHYREVLSALRRRDMEPLVTLHHFTNPAWFAHAGGWLMRRNVTHFARYVDCVAGHLGDQVRWWITINEPTVYAKNAFVSGNWPPCRRGDWAAAWRAVRNMGRAHRRAYEILHRHRPDALVGFAHSAPLVVPRQPARLFDHMAARLRDFVLNRAPFRLMSGAFGRRFDFIGLNYYCRTVVHWQARGAAAVFGRDWLADDQGEPRAFSDIGWEIYPDGLKQQLARFASYGVPLLITENGLATTDEQLRLEFLRRHLRSLADAVGDGIPVVGYLYWSLMDNFEWSSGTAPRFGLAATDFQTQQRSPRPAAAYFAAVCKSNALPDDPTAGCKPEAARTAPRDAQGPPTELGQRMPANRHW
jgi:beta-glucosidase